MKALTKLPTRLSKIRKEKKISQKELADKIGITSAAVGQYERGERKPSLEILIGLAQHFNISISYLLGLSDEERTTEQIKKEINKSNEIEKLILNNNIDFTREEIRYILTNENIIQLLKLCIEFDEKENEKIKNIVEEVMSLLKNNNR